MAEGSTASNRLLAGRYTIGALIGRGGMADVYVGTDARLGRRVAVKLLKASLANDPAFRTRFRQEAQAAARMAHPTIVRVFDAGEDTVHAQDGSETLVPFIVMEYVEGRLLKDIIAEGPLEQSKAAQIAEGVLTALEYSHRAGVVHRDIKPGNIMITPTGQVKVMDFGIARAISDSAATVAETSAILGTAQYFSPEQARGESVDARTDLYSTGVVLFEMLAGRPPFRGDSPVAVAYQHLSEQPLPPSALNPAVSPALDAVVLHALAKDRFERFQSASEFRADISAAAAGQVPTRKVQTANDFNATLFGVNPQSVASSEAAMRRLTVDDEERLARNQNGPPVAWIWAGVAIMIVIVAAVLWWVFHLTPTDLTTSAAIKVPSLSGQSFNSAHSALVAKKLTATEFDISSDTVPSGQVIRTDPPAGTSVNPGYQVKVYVSTGKPTLTMPDFTQQDQNAAQAAIAKAKLVYGQTTTADSPSIPAGVVISTNPAAGATVDEGATVDLVVSTGTVLVPDVTGQTITAAYATLLGTDLQLKPQAQADPTCKGQAVTAQSLPPGEQPQGSPITLTYCSGN